MKHIIVACLLIVGFVAAGCATTKSTQDLSRISKADDLSKLSRKEIAAYNANPDNTDKIVCTTEKPVGSHIPQRVCHWDSAMDIRRDQDQRAMKAIQNSTSAESKSQ